MSIVINFGAWGGFYVIWGYTKRVCLGWMAITLVPFDVDQVMLKVAEMMRAKD